MKPYQQKRIDLFRKKFDGIWEALNDWCGEEAGNKLGYTPRTHIESFLLASMELAEREAEIALFAPEEKKDSKGKVIIVR